MLIFLTQNLLETGISNYSKAILLSCLENLLTARFEGKHIVLAESPSIITTYQRESGLSDKAKMTLTEIKKQVQQQEGIALKNEIGSYIRVVSPSQSDIIITENKNAGFVVNVPIWYFEDSEASQQTLLMGENINDVKFFIRLVEAYITTYRDLKKIVEIQAKPSQGGGSTIKSMLDEQCKSRTFCLCIVDNDCTAPNTAFGGTARALGLSQEKWQSWQNITETQQDGSIKIGKESALAKAFALKQREVENFIPTALIEDALPKGTGNDIFEQTNLLKEWEKRYPGEWRKFIDLKKGLQGYDVLRWTDDKNEPAQQCWLKFRQNVGKDSLNFKKSCQDGKECNKKAECDCDLWAGLGEKILVQVVEFLNSEMYRPKKVAKYFNFKEEPSLLELSHELLVWCCASKRIRA